MCGIHGIISQELTRPELRERLRRMGEVQRHRGPDDMAVDVHKTPTARVGLGFVRLSILDLETGMQPIQHPVDECSIICNGQIYNYIELREELKDEQFRTQGDMEVGLNAYRRFGIDFLNRLNGMYAGAIYDPREKKLLLFRDRFGIKPLYYAQFGERFVFASEIKPLLADSDIAPELNRERLATYFSYRYVPGEQTLFKGIKKLPPGSFLEYDLQSHTYQIQRYWSYDLQEPDDGLTPELAEEGFLELFQDAVRIRLRSDVEVGSLISGGIDSSAVASQAAREKPGIRLFTIGFEEALYNELTSVQRFVSNHSDRFDSQRFHHRTCGKDMLQNLTEIVRAVEEPICLGAMLPTDQVCKLSSERVKVVLTGEGADEIFSGYRKFLIEAAAHDYPGLGATEQRRLRELYPELEPYLAVRDPDPIKRYIQSELLFGTNDRKRLLGADIPDDGPPIDALPKLPDGLHPLLAAQAMESRFRLPDYVILRLDKLSMRHSLETRTPFLDYRLAEFAAKLPISLKVDVMQAEEKAICRRSFLHSGILDLDTVSRKKQPFTIPLADWLSEPESLPERLQEILLGDVIKQQGILDPELTSELVRSVSTQGVGPATLVSNADRVFSVLIFSLWADEFLT